MRLEFHWAPITWRMWLFGVGFTVFPDLIGVDFNLGPLSCDVRLVWTK